jgi:hypothetical protein
MKTVFENAELPHIWAHQSQGSGRGHNLFFEDGTIYSYGKHFPIATHTTDAHGGHCILFTTRTFRNATNKHLSHTRRAIPQDVPVYHVVDPTHPVSEFTLDNYRDMVAHEVNICRASKSARNIGHVHSLIAEMRLFKAAFNLKGGVPNPDLERENVKHRQWHEQRTERQHLADAARFEKSKKYEIERVEKFLGISPLPFEVKSGMAYLRRTCVVNKSEDNVSEYVQTTQGAEVPLEHVLRVAPIVLALIRGGKTYKKNGHTIHLGTYTLDEITEDGTVIAGCHKFSREEVERFAKEIGV